MGQLLSLDVLSELKKKIRKHPLLESRDGKVEEFILDLISSHFPKDNELRTTKSKDIFCKELNKLFMELDKIVINKKKAAK